MTRNTNTIDESSEFPQYVPPLRPVTDGDIQREDYLLAKTDRGLDLLTGKESLAQKDLTKQIDSLSYLFWRGSEPAGITACGANDLQRAKLIVSTFQLNHYPVTELLIEDNILPRTVNRQGKGCSLSVKQIMKIRRELIAFNLLVAKYMSGEPCYDYAFTSSGFDQLRRARLALMEEPAQ